MMRCRLLFIVAVVTLSLVEAQPQPQLMSAMTEEAPPEESDSSQPEPQLMSAVIEESPPEENDPIITQSGIAQQEPQLMSMIEEPTPEFMALSGVAQEECPLMPGCCEEDCCGLGTAYSSPFCLPAPGEPGFTGVYSDDFVRGCVPRDCCESDCCGEGTIYDPSIASCIPEFDGEISGAALAPPLDEESSSKIAGAAQAPLIEGDEYYPELQEFEIGDGSIGSVCANNEDCDSGNCHYGFWYGGYGFCACKPDETNAGCQDGYVCLANLEETQGIADAGPGCYLPYNASCTPGQYECVTGGCDEISGRCPCNSFTNYPCDVKNGEICMADDVQGEVCKVPLVKVPIVDQINENQQIGEAMVAPDDEMMIPLPEFGMAIRAPYPEENVEVGDGSLYSVCYKNEDCDSNYCNYGFFKGGYGSCTCNPETNVGCEEGYECFGNLIEAQRIADAPPDCYLPVGSDCTPGEWDCITGNCDKLTAKCACSTFSQYPCNQDEEICVNDEEEGHICEQVERTLGSDCLTNNHCDSGSCYFDPETSWAFDAPGVCVCTKESGCEDGYICADSGDLFEAQMLMDAAPSCVKDLGEACDPTKNECLSGLCDKRTNKCACNPGTNFGCNADSDEVCILDGNNSYVCQASSGVQASGIQVSPPLTGAIDCPSPAADVMCPMIYAPVVCVGGCTYSNKCVAYNASDEFNAKTCQPA